MTALLGLDQRLFHLLNGTWHVPLLDAIMPIFTSGWFLACCGITGVALLALLGGGRGRRTALALVLALSLTDAATAQLLKPAFHRLRPCRSEPAARVLVHCGGRNGFPSNHAGNAAALTVVLACCFSLASVKWSVPLMLAVGWSRIYVGVHFPGDVLAGFFFGALVGGAVGWLFTWRGRRKRALSPEIRAKEAGGVASGGDLG